MLTCAPGNPFAKSAQPPKASSSSALLAAPARSGPSNPFAKTNASHSAGLKKTGSFFNRVDASNGIESGAPGAPAASTSAAGSKQSTLFGSKPKAVPEKEKKASNKGKKRKSDAAITGADEEDNVNVTTVQKKPKSLNSFWSKDAAASKGKEKPKGAASPAEVAEETQVATQESSPAPAQDAEPALDETNGDESAEMEQVEPVTPFAENGEAETAEVVESDAEQEAVSSPAKVNGNDGMSKLAAFRANVVSKPKAALVETVAADGDVDATEA